MINVRSFQLGAFLEKILARGGDVSEVYYTFDRQNGSYIRRVVKFNNIDSLKIIDTRNMATIRIDKGFLITKYPARIEEYKRDRSKPFGPKCILITIFG